MQKIGPCLWFNGEADAAATFYTSVFRNSRILERTHYLEGSHRPEGSTMTVRFMLDGQEFVALNGGPQFTFSPAISFIAPCENQAEIDELYSKLCEGGSELQCGWVTDRFGVSWQIVPTALLTMISSPDTAAAKRAILAMMPMKKLDIAALETAFKGA
jgi:predicted 3-demethylubiquinone-9 3-methyltransferase (glyoxalase superfamily)